jgi:glycosyltransferase involved in cell wall biosynthesis
MSTLRIAVDVTPIRAGGECGGAKPFVLELLKGMAAAPRRHEYLLLTAGHNDGEFAAHDALNVTRRRVDTIDRQAAPRRLRDQGIDVLFCPMTAPTFAEPGVPTVSILYDLQHVAYPWFFSTTELAHRTAFYRQLSEVVDHVVCISEFSRISLIRHVGVHPDRTSVAPIAIHDRVPRCEPDAAWQVLAGSGFPRCRFAFYPANFWPHKNHRMLLVAFGRFLKNRPDSDLHLVLTGEHLGEGAGIASAIERMGLTSRVHVLGFVPDTQLGALWSTASFLVFPSLFEGFGIPLTEAMQFGIPILCSREGSLPEVGGDEAVYFDARRPQSVIDALGMAVDHPEEMRRRTIRAQDRLSAYRPAAVVERYLDVFDRVTARTPVKLAQTPERHDDGRLLTPIEAYVKYLETESAQNRAGLGSQIAALESALRVSEADRAARLDVIVQQGREVAALQSALETSEADRAARLDVIVRQGAEIGEYQQRVAAAERLAARGIVRQIIDRWRGSRLWPSPR